MHFYTESPLPNLREKLHFLVFLQQQVFQLLDLLLVVQRLFVESLDVHAVGVGIRSPHHLHTRLALQHLEQTPNALVARRQRLLLRLDAQLHLLDRLLQQLRVFRLLVQMLCATLTDQTVQLADVIGSGGVALTRVRVFECCVVRKLLFSRAKLAKQFLQKNQTKMCK